MDILTALDRGANYTKIDLQFILAGWVLSQLAGQRDKIAVVDGDVDEDDYDKRSVYSLLYAMYRAVGTVPAADGTPYELTFNTWGYDWPKGWGPCPTSATDPQRFGKNAYTGLYASAALRSHLEARGGAVHVVEMGCGTGAGAHHVCSHVLPNCTYEAVDMQRAAIETCKRKFVRPLGGRLVATWADATRLPIADARADIVAVNETHVTEHVGQVTPEDERFFAEARRVLKPGGHLVWGNAIPTETWRVCLAHLEARGFDVLDVQDVTAEAIRARDEDAARIDAYVAACVGAFHGFRIPWLGAKRRREAEVALKNFARNPGTRLYQTMCDGTDAYKVVVARKQPAA